MKKSLIIIGMLILGLSFQSTASEVMPQCCGGIAADQNCDGVVDAADLALAESHWGLTIWEDPDFDPAFDLDSNGEIDLVDINVLLAHVGET